MNLPNKLTVLRVIMIPVFLLFFFADNWSLHYLIALIIFALASLTDMLDGHIARKHNLITDFGKLMDPLADKLLVTAAMVSLIAVDMVHAIPVILILTREFLVTAIRQIAAQKGVILAADNWGKIKTVCQMFWLCFGLLYLQLALLPIPQVIFSLVYYVYWILMLASLFFTVASGLNYFIKNKSLFSDM